MSDESDLGKDIAAKLAADIYKDLAHPTAERVGRALDSISKIALSPIALIDWSYEQAKDWLKEKISERLRDIPPEFVTGPSLRIAIPVITHVAMAHDSPTLRDMYAELLLKAMDSRSTQSVHPSYVYLVEQLSPEEALILKELHKKPEHEAMFSSKVESPSYSNEQSLEKQFTGFCSSIASCNEKNAAVWLDNMLRLRLLSIEMYVEPEYVGAKWHQDAYVKSTEIRNLSFTSLGERFIEACSSPTGVG
ncbi:MAG: DUF4393 domain-containing protein [Stagnimonas sp.]|nr:DUF4393 domain-containing protein [Stagnimonas sp.]